MLPPNGAQLTSYDPAHDQLRQLEARCLQNDADQCDDSSYEGRFLATKAIAKNET